MVGTKRASHHRAQIIQQGFGAPCSGAAPGTKLEMGARAMLMGFPYLTTEQLSAVLQHRFQLRINRAWAREQGRPSGNGLGRACKQRVRGWVILTADGNPYQWWMDRLLRVAAKAGQRGEVPVAAVVLDPRGRAIGWGSNRREGPKTLGHAELVALSQASALRHDWRFNQHTLIVTLEPCPMCAGALVQAAWAGVYGASDPKRGALGDA